MKIDFNGTYDRVSRLVGVPNSPVHGPKEFQEVLGSVAPKKSQATDNVDKSESLPPQKSESSTDLMGMLKLMRGGLRPPDQAPIKSILPPAEEVNTPAHGVKTPSVIDVKRINAYAGLNSAERMNKVGSLINAHGKEHGVDPALAMAVAEAESSFNPAAVSTDGHASKGLFQLLDSTGTDLHKRAGIESEYDPFNPKQNVTLGLQYLRRLHDTFGTATELPTELRSVPAANSSELEKLAVAAFNAGEGRVAAAQARAVSAGKDASNYAAIAPYLPKSTQEYVSRVMQLKNRFASGTIG